MADRGRDLKVSILSDADRFDLAHPADELDTLADAAADTGTALDKLGTDTLAAGDKLDTLGKDTKGAGDDLDTLAKDAKATATKVDSAFDKIARSSKTGAKDVAKGARDSGDSVKEFGDETKSVALESAASFDGSMSSIADSGQELAANLLQSLGPVGAGIGVAAAVGIGIFRAGAEKAKQTLTDLTDAMISDGGRLSDQSVIAKLQTFASDGSILDLKRQAEAAHIPVSDFLNALAGDADALTRSQAAIEAHAVNLAAATEGQSEMNAETVAFGGDLVAARDALTGQAETSRTAADAIAVLTGATDTSTLAQEAFADAVKGFSDPLAAYTGTLADKKAAEQKSAEATAAATKDQSDSWEDYVDDVDVSVANYLTALAKQVKAQEDWEANMTALAGKVSDDTLAELARMGPEGAPLVAKLAAASDKELGKLDALLKRRAGSGVDAFAAGIADGADHVGSAAAKARKAATDVFHRPIVATLELDTAQFHIDLGLSTQAAKNASERYRP